MRVGVVGREVTLNTHKHSEVPDFIITTQWGIFYQNILNVTRPDTGPHPCVRTHRSVRLLWDWERTTVQGTDLCNRLNEPHMMIFWSYTEDRSTVHTVLFDPKSQDQALQLLIVELFTGSSHSRKNRLKSLLKRTVHPVIKKYFFPITCTCSAIYQFRLFWYELPSLGDIGLNVVLLCR